MVLQWYYPRNTTRWLPPRDSREGRICTYPGSSPTVSVLREYGRHYTCSYGRKDLTIGASRATGFLYASVPRVLIAIVAASLAASPPYRTGCFGFAICMVQPAGCLD